MRTKPERLDAPLTWLRNSKYDLAPLTGTDTRALLAIARCWKLYFNADRPELVLQAVAALLRCMQPKCWHFAKALIPWAGDWSHEETVWQRLSDADPSIVRDFFGCAS